MSDAEVIAELTDLCIRQAEVIKALMYSRSQVMALEVEEEAIATREELEDLVGEWEI